MSRGLVASRAILDRATVHVIADDSDEIAAEFPDAVATWRVSGFQAALAVPLLRGDEPIGAFFVARRQRRRFTPRQIGMLEAFADQAVIARITSYNVCYTKLLRFEALHPGLPGGSLDPV